MVANLVANLVASLVASLVVTGPAAAATWRVGPDAALHTLSEAAALAGDGDTVLIAAGSYFDCATWTGHDLTVAGDPGGSTVLTDRACEGKASFVVRGERMAVRDLTFTRIRVADGNGAGIRAEGGDLLVERARFLDDQIGILAADRGSARLVLRDCVFRGNGRVGEATGDLLVGRVALLRVERSRFEGGSAGGRGGPSITTGAGVTELLGDRFAARPARYLVGGPEGGALALDDIVFELGPGPPPRLGAVWLGPDGAGAVSLRRSVLRNPGPAGAILLRDWRDTSPVMQANAVAEGDIALSTDGATWARAKAWAHHAIGWARSLAAASRHLAANLWRAWWPR